MYRSLLVVFTLLVLLITVPGCAPDAAPTVVPGPVAQPNGTGIDAPPPALQVIAVESFLADIAQNVAGSRLKIDTLLPFGADPHSFEPTPQDVKKVADSNVLIANGAGFEGFLARLLENAGGERTVIEASRGLPGREAQAGETAHAGENGQAEHGDPHFWFNPLNVIRYVENIREGLTAVDPAGANVYKTNAEAYIEKLKALDVEIQTQIDTIPAANRKLVTDHDTFGYFADRYGFEIVGMLIPSLTTADSSTAQQLAALVNRIKSSGVKAVFVETGMNPQLAEQVAQDTGVQIVTGLYTHSLSEPTGPAPTYIQMLEYNARKIVDALK